MKTVIKGLRMHHLFRVYICQFSVNYDIQIIPILGLNSTQQNAAPAFKSSFMKKIQNTNDKTRVFFSDEKHQGGEPASQPHANNG